MGKQGKSAAKKKTPVWPVYLLLLILLLLYALHNNPIIGLAVFVVLVFILVLEFRVSIHTEGARKSVYDILYAIGIAVAIWVVLIIVLQTTSPVDAVASCSMLPVLHRGDLVVLHGISNMSSFVEQHRIPVINMTQAQFSSLESNMSSEFLSFYAFVGNNESKITEVIPPGLGYSVALYNTKCLDAYSYLGQQDNYYRCISSQSNNLIKYNYAIGKEMLNGSEYSIVYTSSIVFGNETIIENYSNPIIIYRTTSQDSFSGDIIHRLYAVIHVGNEYYTLTKGDNNPALDIEFSNYPAGQNDIVGYVLADIPIVGYLKLIISGQLGSVPGCNQQILH